MKMTKLGQALLAMFLLVGTSTTLSAAGDATSLRDAPWRFSAKVYGWLPKAPADIKIDQEEVANLPESLDNILDSVELTAMAEFEAHKGPLGFFVSPVYYDGKDDEDFKGLVGEKRKVTLKESAWVIDYGAGYQAGPALAYINTAIPKWQFGIFGYQHWSYASGGSSCSPCTIRTLPAVPRRGGRLKPI